MSFNKVIINKTVRDPDDDDMSEKASQVRAYKAMGSLIENDGVDGGWTSYIDDVVEWSKCRRIDYNSCTFEELVEWYNGIAPPGAAPIKPQNKRREVESDTPSDVSSSSAWLYLQSDDAVMVKMWLSVQPECNAMRGSEFKARILAAATAAQEIPDSASMGEYRRISAAEYSDWHATRSREYAYVGPYLYMKLLQQGGSKWENWTHPDGNDMLLFSRNGVSVYGEDKYTVAVDSEDADPQDLTRAVEGIKVGGKQIRLVDVPRYCYEVVDTLLYFYDVNNKEKSVVFGVRTDPVKYSKAIMDKIAEVLQVIKGDDSAPTGVNADETIDWLARVIALRCVDVAKQLSLLLISARVQAESSVKPMIAAAMKARPMKASEKEAYFKKMDIPGTVLSSVGFLKAARKLRNRAKAPQTSQYIQKNVASVYASNHIQMLDTHHKLRNVCWRLQQVTPGLVDKKTISVYGVAYNHLGRGIDEITGSNDIIYYDTKQPKGSGLKVAPGNIFDYAPRGEREILIDDTLVVTIPELLKKANPGLSACAVKLKKIVSRRPYAFACKVSLDMFEDSTRMKEFLLESDYRSVEVAKFGKLHNQEVFVIGSRDEKTRVRKSAGILDTDLFSCCVAVHLSNKIIQAADKLGVRAPVNGDMWRKLVTGLPSVWPWYMKKYTKDAPLRGGTGIADFEEGGSGTVRTLEDVEEPDGYKYPDMDVTMPVGGRELEFELPPMEYQSIPFDLRNEGLNHPLDVQYLMGLKKWQPTLIVEGDDGKPEFSYDSPHYVLTDNAILLTGDSYGSYKVKVLRCGAFYVGIPHDLKFVCNPDFRFKFGPGNPSLRSRKVKNWKEDEHYYGYQGEKPFDGMIYQ